MKSIATSTRKGDCGCGCGGSSTPAKSGCSCHGAGCDACNETGFIRPRFFAGQLLTEDDLGLFVKYVLDKNRLHNRHLWGDGIVCGLEVAAHPCGKGRVIIRPGYALDCCGNDIFVNCAKELDINAMVKALRISTLGGFDCGDPCPPASDNGCDEEGDDDGSVYDNDVVGDDDDDVEDEVEGDDDECPPPGPSRTRRHYCLYVRYCESEAEPISPFLTGDPCGSQACEPSRIQEGFRFELRCRSDAAPSLDMMDRFFECLGPSRTLQKMQTTSRFLDRYAYQIPPARDDSSTIDAFDPVKMAQDVEVLEKAAGDIPVFEKSEDAAAEWVELRLDAVAESARVVAMHTVRFYAVPPVESIRKVKAVRSRAVAPSAISRAHQSLGGFAKILSSDRIRKVLEEKPVLERIYLETLAEKAATLSSPLRKGVKDDRDLVHVAAGYIRGPALDAELSSGMETLVEDLRDRVEVSHGGGASAMYATLDRLRIPQADSGGTPSALKVSNYHHAARTLAPMLNRFVLDCFCRNVLPPCRPCTDLGVLLACLEVDECEVVEICNLVRKLVLTPVSIDYWLPRACRTLTDLCCPEAVCPEDSRDRQDDRKQLASVYQGRLPVGLEKLVASFYLAMLNSPCRKLSRRDLAIYQSVILDMPRVRQLVAAEVAIGG